MTLTRWELYERQLAKFRPIPLKTTHSSGGVEVVRCRPAEGGWEIFYIVTYQGQEWSRWSSPEGALEYALFYVSYGLSVIPLKPGEKTPLIKWEDYQNAPPSLDEVQNLTLIP